MQEVYNYGNNNGYDNGYTNAPSGYSAGPAQYAPGNFASARVRAADPLSP